MFFLKHGVQYYPDMGICCYTSCDKNALISALVCFD